jgi:putative pyruvate formate lyase activating enzyme
LRIASAVIHRGEEPPLSGAGGSGAVFVSGCNLGCVFCQNWQISANHAGIEADTDLFVRICRALKEKGVENINIVTGSHVVPALIEGVAAAKRQLSSSSSQTGFLPVLWNSSAYETPQTLETLAGTVDVFLPDIKTLDVSIAARYFNAPDYPAVAAAAIKKMIQLKPLRFEEKGDGITRLVSGCMARHLVLPGHLDSTRLALRWFADLCMAGSNALLSLMFQYTPLSFGKKPSPGEPPEGYVTQEEYQTVLEWLAEFGIEDGYCQELAPGADWLPDFDQTNPFPADLAEPVWHWKTGFCG